MKKSLLVSLTAVLIFGLMGLGFAMWSDTVLLRQCEQVRAGRILMCTNDNILTDKILGRQLKCEDGVLDA